MRRRPAWLPLATDVNCSYTKVPRAVQSRVPKAGLRSALSRRMIQNVAWPVLALSSATAGSTVLVEWLDDPAAAATGNNKRTVTRDAHNAYVERTLIPPLSRVVTGIANTSLSVALGRRGEGREAHEFGRHGCPRSCLPRAKKPAFVAAWTNGRADLRRCRRDRVRRSMS